MIHPSVRPSIYLSVFDTLIIDDILLFFQKKKLIMAQKVRKFCFYCTKFNKQEHVRVTLRFYILSIQSTLS